MKVEEFNDVLELHKQYRVTSGRDGIKAELSGIHLRNMDLSGSALVGAVLNEVDFSGSILSESLFCDAKLMYSKFDGCDLSNVDFSRADLTGASFSNTNMINVRFNRAKLYNIQHKMILQFTANKDTAYYYDGCISLLGVNETLQWWLNNYREVLGNQINPYNNLEIDLYGSWMNSIQFHEYDVDYKRRGHL